MKRLIAILFLAGLGVVAPLGAFDQPPVCQLKPKDHVVFFGDSTTVDGGDKAGYVQLVIQALDEQVPGQGVKVSAICKNTRTTSSMVGAGGWIQDKLKPMLAQEDPPRVSVIVLGLNDSKAGEKGVAPYLANLRQSVAQLRELKQTVILTTPTTWGGLAQTKPYAEAARTLATELKCPLIDLYAVHADHIVRNTQDGKFLPGTSPTRDGVHMTEIGETLSAGAILQAFGLKPVWQKYQLRVGCSGGGKVTVEPDLPLYAPGTKITLTVLAEVGCTFQRWFNFEGVEIKEDGPRLTFAIERHTWTMAEVRPSEQKKP